MGIDYGGMNIGLAIGHTETGLAMPLRSFRGLPRHAFVEELRPIITTHGIKKLIIGLPLSLNGQDLGDMVKNVHQFGDQCSKLLDVPVDYVDERFSSEAAKKLKRDFPHADEDALSAMCILQTYLDRQKHNHHN